MGRINGLKIQKKTNFITYRAILEWITAYTKDIL